MHPNGDSFHSSWPLSDPHSGPIPDFQTVSLRRWVHRLRALLLGASPLHGVDHLLRLRYEIIKHDGRAVNGNNYRLALHVQESHAGLIALLNEDIVFERRNTFYSADVYAVRPASPSVALR